MLDLSITSLVQLLCQLYSGSCAACCGDGDDDSPFIQESQRPTPKVAWRLLWAPSGLQMEGASTTGLSRQHKASASLQPFQQTGNQRGEPPGAGSMGSFDSLGYKHGMIYYLPGWMWSLWPVPSPSPPGSGRNNFSIFKQEQTEMIRHFPMKGGV